MQVNQIWQGKYQILEFLGHGSLGDVYRARDRFVNREVAIKSIDRANFSPTHANEVVEKLNLMSPLWGHPSIVNLHTVEPGTRDVIVYIVSEYVSGGNLRVFWKNLESTGKDHPQSAIDIAIDLCQGLQAAHSLNIYHLNIKPTNVLMTPDGRAKLADFYATPLLTLANVVPSGHGRTLEDYAPEQYDGEGDGRADIYAIGLLLYEMLVGQLPFHGTVQEVRLQKQAQDIEIPSSVPGGLEPIIRKALQCEPAHRFQEAIEMADALRQAKISLYQRAISYEGLTPDEVQKVRSHWKFSLAEELLLIKGKNERFAQLLKARLKGSEEGRGSVSNEENVGESAAGQTEIVPVDGSEQIEIPVAGSISTDETDFPSNDSEKQVSEPPEEVLQPELKELNKLIVAHKQGATWFTEKLASTEAKLNVLGQENQQLTQTVKWLETKHSEKRELLKDIHDRLKATARQNKALDQTRLQLEQQLRETETQLQEQQEINAQLNVALKRAEENLVSVSEEDQQWRQKSDELQQENLELTTEVEMLRQALTDKEAEMAQLAEALQTAQKELNQSNVEREDLQRQQSELKERLTQECQTVEAQKRQLEEAIQSCQAFRDELEKGQARLRQVESELEAERGALDQLRQALAATESRLLQEREARQQLEQHYQEALQAGEVVTEELKQARGAMDNRIAESAKLATEVEEALQSSETVAEELNQVKRILNERIAESAKLAAEIESVRQEVANRDARLDEARKALDQSQAHLAEETESRARLLNEKAEALKQLEKVQQELKGKEIEVAQALQQSQETKRIKEIQSEATSEEMKHMLERLRLLEEQLSHLSAKSATQSQQLQSEEQLKILIKKYWSVLDTELQQAIPDTMKIAIALEGLKQQLA